MIRTVRRVVLARFDFMRGTHSYLIPPNDHPEIGDVIITSVRWETADGFKVAMNARAGLGVYDDDLYPYSNRRNVDEVMDDNVFGTNTANFPESVRMANVVDVKESEFNVPPRYYMHLIKREDLCKAGTRNLNRARWIESRHRAIRELDKMVENKNRKTLYEALAKESKEAKALLDVVNQIDLKEDE